MRLRRGTATGVAVAIALLVAVTACGSSATPSARNTARAATAPAHVSAVTPGPLPSALPATFNREAANPDPHYDFGLVVQITPDGFHPAELVAPCCMPVMWQNLTSVSQAIWFDAFAFGSGPIASGTAYTYTPKSALSLFYHSAADGSRTGVVDVTAQEP